MESPSAPGGGLLHSLRRFGSSAVELVEVRLELLATEAELEKLRIARALLLGALALMLFGVALLIFVGLVVLLVEPPYRWLALAALGLALAAIGAACLRRAKFHLEGPPEGAFALTRAEFRRDRDGLAPPAP